MKRKIRLLWWRVRAFFDRRYKSPVANEFKFGEQMVVLLGFPKKFSREIIRGDYLYQFDEHGSCRGMIDMKIFEKFNDPRAKE